MEQSLEKSNKIQKFSVKSIVEELAKNNVKVSEVTILSIFRRLNVQPSRKELLPNGRTRFYFDRKSMVVLALHLRNRIKSRKTHVSCCSRCGRTSKEQILVCGLCVSCHARKFVENYCHYGDKIKNPFSEVRAEALLSALLNILKNYRKVPKTV